MIVPPPASAPGSDRTADQIRTLHVVPSLGEANGGLAYAAVSICAGLNGHAQHTSATLVSTVTPADQLGYLESWEAGPIRLFPRSRPAARFYSRELRRWLGREVGSFELVHIHGVFHAPALLAAAACRRAGVPYVVQPHGQLDPFDLQKHRLPKKVLGPLLFRRFLARSSAVVLTAATESDRLETFGAAVTKHVVPLGIRFESGAGDGTRLRAEVGIEPDAPVLLFLGRIDEKKGLDLLVEAFGQVGRAHPRAVLVIAGDGEDEYRTSIDRRIAASGVGQRIFPLGWVRGERKADVLAAADLFCLPSRNENFGIAVVEALAAGLPVLVSDEVYIHDVITSEGVGTVCRPTAASLTAELDRLLGAPGAIASMASPAAAAARRRFSLATAAEALEPVYQGVVDAGSETRR